MNREIMEDVEEIIGKNLSRIIKISYATDIRDRTSPGYVIPCLVNKLEKKFVSPDGSYIKICSMLDSERNPIERIAPSEIPIKDICGIEVLDYLIFHKREHLPLSDIVEVYFKEKETEPEEKETEPEFTSLFTLENKKNIKKSLEEIKNRKYLDSNFEYSHLLVVLDSIGEIN